MTADVRNRRTAAVTLFILFAVSCVTNGAIIVRKERLDSPKKISIQQAKQLLQREKRSASTTPTPPGADDRDEVLLNEVVLNGSEHHSRAYVHWSGKKTSDMSLEWTVMFILTVQYNRSGVADSLLWRSEDYGSTYRQYPFGSGALISYFFVSPADPTRMVFTDIQNKRLYTTQDELKTHNHVPLPVATDDIYMHPNKAEWMLLYDYYKKDLYVTMNFGAHWDKLATDVYNFEWAVAGVDQPGIVHMETHPWDSEDAFYKRCTIPDCNSTGDGVDTQLGPFLTYTMQVLNEYIFAQKVLMNGKESHMLVSHMRQNFSNAYFPANVGTKDFMILDANEGQVFLAVNHGDRMGASLYLSDPTGRYYTLSLTDLHHRSFGHWFDVDMHRVKGQNGTYLANQQTKSNSNKLKSFISFNKGGDWLKIPSPKGANCKDKDCPLVLRLDMDNYFSNWILSEKRAPGFIVAHGHYGHDYEVSWSNLTVFTSSDGGYTWKEATLKDSSQNDMPLKGAFHFNILDQGSIVTAIKTGYRENSSQVFYSYNEGATWHSKKFRNDTLHVSGVLNEPNINTLVLSVYGHVNRSSPWTMVKLNFSKVLSRKCQEPADYVNWQASDHDKNIKENCLLGQEVIYRRKKPGPRCFNGEQFNRTIQKRTCNCEDEDFECDFGFSFKDNICKRESWFDDGYIAPECVENQPFNMSRGYRKVGSDKCTGGVAGQDKYQVDTTAICKLVKPGRLLLTSNMTVVASGQPVLFHLLQKRGSVHTTQYSWNFSDSHVVTQTGLSNTQHQVHIFRRQGLFPVTVTAHNADGESTSNLIHIRAEYPIRHVAVFSAWAVRVGVPLTISASSNLWYHTESSLHFLYRFGDEATQSKELLTYSSNVTHVYNTSKQYTITVTAVNSISAATKQMYITAVDDGIVAQLTFSPNVDRLFGRYSFYYYEGMYFWLERFRLELTMLLGVKLDRMALSMNSTSPVRLDCLVLPKPSDAPAYEMTAEQISQSFMDMVDNQTLSLFQTSPYMIRWLGDINVTAIRIMDFIGNKGGNKSGNGTHHSGNSTDHGGNSNSTHHGDGGKGSGINKRAISIAVPVVGLAGIVTVVLIVCYRRRSRAHRYSMLNQDGAADRFFDEEDELPLDMSDARDTGRSQDDALLDLRSGGQLVLMSGNGEEA